jgi:hypothetical protein
MLHGARSRALEQRPFDTGRGELETSASLPNGTGAVRIVAVFTQSFDRWPACASVEIEQDFTASDSQNSTSNKVCVLAKREAVAARDAER